MNAVKEKLVDVCIVVTITLAMLLGLELAARAAREIRDIIISPPAPPSTILKQAWGPQHALDLDYVFARHADYVEFREAPYRSPTITVDEEGRRTVPGNCEMANPFVVWAFGGSTMFGYGAPDQFTIPAYLAKLLNHEGRCAKIVNFGAASWQSTQSLIQLIESLKRGGRPQVVIFYDGVNESDTEGPSPGGLNPEIKMRLDQAIRGHSPNESLVENSVLVRVIAKIVFGMRQKHLEQARSSMLADFPAHVRAVASIYAQNVRIVDVLAKEYGFSAYFFLQPFPMISEKKLTPTENAILKHPNSMPEDVEMFRAFYRAFRQEPALKSHPRYFDISGIFDGMTEELFVGDAHLLPAGNRIVAERIAREIKSSPVAK